jgi:hypothetical protein
VHACRNDQADRDEQRHAEWQATPKATYGEI